MKVRKIKMKKFELNYDYSKNKIFAIETAREIIEILENGEYDNLDTALNETIDRKLIYYDDQWEMMKTYQTPQDANYYTALEMFIEELYSIIKEEEIEEELNEEYEEER